MFARKANIQLLKFGYKFTREIGRRMLHFRGEPLAVYPAFPPGGRASVIEKASGPVPFYVPRIAYSEQDEHALEEFARV